jgi:hypothetical protein
LSNSLFPLLCFMLRGVWLEEFGFEAFYVYVRDWNFYCPLKKRSFKHVDTTRLERYLGKGLFSDWHLKRLVSCTADILC